MNIQNKVFSIIVCLIFIGPVLMFGAMNVLKIELPGWITSEEVQYLEGASIKYGVKDNLNMDGLASGRLQSALEDKVEDYVPCRAGAIITSAALQRVAIETSNLVTHWSCYPTFYGSDKVYSPEFDSVAYMPEPYSKDVFDRLEYFSEGVKRIAERYPEKRFIIYLVLGYEEPSFTPASALMSDDYNPLDAYEFMNAILEESENVEILTRRYSIGDEYYEKFFATDHHWNISGAIEGYSQIVDSLDLQENNFGTFIPMPDYEYTGATARWGRDLIKESVFDVEDDFSYLRVDTIDGYVFNGANHDVFKDYPEAGKQFAFYDAYYDSIPSLSTITGGSGDKCCLLISNSYGAALQRPLATSYKELHVSQVFRHPELERGNLEYEIDCSNPDDVIFVANPSAIIVPDDYFD